MVESSNSQVEINQFLLESVINAMPIFIYWKDVNLAYVGCNKHYATINGFEKTTEIIGKKDENLAWARYRHEQIQTSDQRVIKNNVPEYNIIESWILPNGNEVIYNTNRIPIRNSEDNVIGILTTYEETTEKIILERNLKESESKFKEITELLPETLFETNLQSFITYINPGGLKKFGLAQEDIDRGITTFELFARDNEREHAINNMKRILLGDDLGPNEYLFSKQDGTLFYGLIHSRPTYKDDKITGIRGIIIDIDERKKSQILIKSEKKKLEYIMGSMIDGLCVTDVDGTITQVNKPFFEMFGFISPKEILGRAIFDFVPNREAPSITKRFMDTINKKEPFIKNFELTCIRKDGKEFPAMLNIRNLWDENEKYVGSISVARDISERRIAELKLRESEKLLRDFLENLNDIAYETDKLGNVTYCNKIIEKYIGLSREKIIGSNFLPYFSEEDGKIAMENYTKTLNGESPIYELTFINSGKTCQFSNKPLKNDKGEIIGVFGIARDITERRKAEEALREREKYNFLLESLTDGVLIIDREWRYLLINDEVARMVQMPKEKLIGNKMTDLFPGIENTVFGKTYSQVLEIGEPATAIDEFTFPDGRKIWYEVKVFPAPEGLLIIVVDITERKKTEQRLKESEDKYRHLFNSTPYAIWLVDLRGKIIDCNNTMNQFMSIFKREDLIGKTFREVIKMFISEGDPRFENLENTFKERFKLLLKQGYLDPIEFQISRGDGKPFWITLETSFVKLGKESLIQAFIKDITERKEAELRIKKSEEELKILNKELEQKVTERTSELRASEEKFRTIFESIPDFFFLVSKDSTIVDYRGLESDLYIPPKEFMGKKMSEIMPPDIGRETQKMINETIDTQKPQNMEYNLQIEDRIQYFEARYLFFSEKRVAIFVRNITDRKKGEVELNESREKLEQQNIELTRLDKAKDDFITMAAHELKTPLISISGYTDYILIKHKDVLSIDIKSDLEIVQRNIARLQLIINQLLDVIKLEALKIDLFLERTNISEIIYKCLHELSYLFKEKEHEVVLNIDNNIILNIDPERIFQVLSNLISNAAKFTPKGGRIEISANKEENRYLFEVIDNGIGLSNDQIPHLFQKFEAVQQKGEEDIQRGTGLGLYIAKGFIRAHGGEMWATSLGMNKGTRICFTIPY